MAIPEKTKYIIVPIETGWFDLHLESDGKYVTLKGKDRNRPSYSPFDGSEYFDIDVLVPVAFEHRRSDYCHATILGEAWDDETKKYLIIEREITEK
jgi:hypothetical protein